VRAYLWTAVVLLAVVAAIHVVRIASISRPILARNIRQIGYWIALALIFSLATWLRFDLRQDPIPDPDTWGYLSPALRKLTGGEFGHTWGRNFVYPGFLFLLLQMFGDFRAISVAQHLLGIIAGAMLLLTWRRVRVFAPPLGVGHDLHAPLGLIALSMFLLSAEPIQAETQIRPEAVCAFLFSINLYLVVDFTACGFVEYRCSRAVAAGAGSVFTAILLASARPSFWFVAAASLLPVAIFSLRRGWLRQKLALAGSVAATAALLWLPEYVLSRHDEVSRTFLPTTLFVVHADLIRDQIAHDLARNRELPYSHSSLRHVHLLLSKAITQSHAAGRYPRLGFNPDDLRYDPTSVTEQLRREFRNDVSALCAFYRFYYWRVWQQRPLSMLKKIAGQMGVFYGPQCPAYTLTKSLPLSRDYEGDFAVLKWPAYREIWASYRPAVDFMNRTRLLAQDAPTIQQSVYVRRPLTVLAQTYRPILLVALVSSVLVLCRQTYRRSLGWLAALILFAYSYNFAACLEVAVVQSLEVGRFTTVQVFPTIIAQFLAIWLVLEFALKLVLAEKNIRVIRAYFGDPGRLLAFCPKIKILA
jgi:hypothetical protein